MTRKLQLLRGTTAQNDVFTGSSGELTVDTTTNELRLHDGSTAGGHIIYNKLDVDTALSGKANVATTLAGYGITDAYTKSEIDTSLSGKANTSLSNLTSTGKNIGNWSSNVTNCITEIPQDIKLELTNGTLTLKAGSKVYVPNGAVYDVVTIANDITFTMTWGGNSKRLLFVRLNGNDWVLDEREVSFSGGAAPISDQYSLWYDTTNNLIKMTSDYGSTWTSGLSFPIALITNTNNVTTSIDHIFNGFGYIGSTVFALPGVKGLIPDGRNADGSLKNTVFTISSVLTTTDASSVTGGLEYYLSGNGIFRQNFGTYEYKPDINYVWDNTANARRGVMLLDPNAYRDSGRVSSFVPKQAFHAVDYSDTEFIAHQAMPSNTTIPITLPVSGGAITAPKDGYLRVIINCSSGGYLSMDYNYFYPLSGGSWVGGIIPAQKGHDVYIQYGNKVETIQCVFIPAVGAQ